MIYSKYLGWFFDSKILSKEIYENEVLEQEKNAINVNNGEWFSFYNYDKKWQIIL